MLQTTPAAASVEREPVRAAGQARPWVSARVLAAMLGLASVLLALAVPLLPVVERTATINWPGPGGVGPVSAPLVAYQPLRLDAAVPCGLARDLGGGVLFATAPVESQRGAATGMALRVGGGLLTLTSAGRELARTRLPGGDCVISVASDALGTALSAGGAATSVKGDVRPQVVGVYTDLRAGTPADGLRVDMVVDTRFQTSAHPVKIAADVLAVLALIGCLLAVRSLDRRFGRRALRMVPRGWWRPTWPDLAVLGTLGVWLVIGTTTTDDGYIETMARAREASGYIGNYFRWFDVAEAPFGWFYEMYAAWVRVSAAGVWLRLPAALMGLACWLLISREVLPRLGREVRRSRAAAWAAAAVLLCWWLPFNNGLRPEPVVALGSLLALCAVERTVATRRLLPAVLGLLAAGLTLAAAPTGLIALVPYLVAGRPLVRLLRERAAAGAPSRAPSGVLRWLAVLAPAAAAGCCVLVAVFADQSLAAVLEATRVRTAIGPSLSWFEEWVRYDQLFDPGPGGSVSRRFPLLVLLLCLATCLIVLLRRSRIPGAALGPSYRLVGTAAVSLVVIALTPTKWTHHFGAFAAVGGALAALTALATSGSVLRSRRNRAAFTAALLLLTAFAFTGWNAWFYVSGFGVPWVDEPPSVAGVGLSSVLLVAALGAAVVAAVEHLRFDPQREFAAVAPVVPRQQRRRLALRLGSAPLSLVCGLMVLGQLASMGIGIVRQWDSYSLGRSHLAQLSGGDCGLSTRVLVEPVPLDGMLPLQPGSAARVDGFEPGGLPEKVSEHTDRPRLPYGFGGPDAPVWGSYVDAGRTVGTVTSGWYALPQAARDGSAPVVVAAAGVVSPQTRVRLEFARAGALVDEIGLPDMESNVFREEPSGWRDLRAALPGRAAATADSVRVVAEDDSLGDWVAVSAPRVPRLTRLIDLVGTSTPVFLHWPVGFVHPCLRPFDVRDGIAEMPAYVVSGLTSDLPGAEVWASPEAGGPRGWLEAAAEQRELPAYLENDWSRDWGHIWVVVPWEPAAGEASVRAGEALHSGWWSAGPMRVP